MRAHATELPNEAALQQLIKEHPETLPLDDLSGEGPTLFTVGRESPVANGYIDVIGVDRDGLVTVIECKLDRNPESKRTVLGQVLGYGAYLWQLSYDAFVARARRILDWSLKQSDRVFWQGGGQYGSFAPAVLTDNGRSVKIFFVYSDGNVLFGFENLLRCPPFDQEARRRQLLDELNQISGLNLQRDRIEKWPGSNIRYLADEQAFLSFTTVMERVASELRGSAT